MNRILQLVMAWVIGLLIGWNLHPNETPPSSTSLAPPDQADKTPAKAIIPPIPLVAATKQPIPPPAPPGVITLLSQGKIHRALDLILQQPAAEQQQSRAMVLQLARNLLHEHHTDAAQALLTAYQRRWPQGLEARQLLAQSMIDLQQYQSAITLLTASMKTTADPTPLRAMRHLLDLAIARYDALLRQRDQRNRLLDFYRQLATNDGNNMDYQLKQAELLIEMGQLTEASALLQPLLFSDASTAKQARQWQRKIDQTLAQSFSDTIALTRLNNHFLVPIQFAGRTLQLLLDTGASLTLMPTAIADDLPATKRGQVTLATANGTMTVPTLRVPQLQLGQQQLRNISVALTDGIAIDGADGLLGMDILKRFHFVIDQEHATLRITPRTASL